MILLLTCPLPQHNWRSPLQQERHGAFDEGARLVYRYHWSGQAKVYVRANL